MKVFKTCMLIARRCFGTLISFVIVFICISVFTSRIQGDTMEAAFKGEAVPFTLINRDENSPIIDGLHEYLLTQAPEIKLEDDEQTLQNALYYAETDYINIVPEGFNENWPNMNVQVSTRPDSMQSYFMDALVDSYFNQVKLQQSLNPAEPEKAVEAALTSLQQEIQVEKQRFGGGLEMTEGYQVYFRLVGYALLMLIYQFISSVQMVFGKKELRMRHGASPLSQRRLTMEVVFYGALISLGICLILLCIAYWMHGDYLAAGGWQLGLLVSVNVLTFMLVAVTLSILCSQFTSTPTVQAIISNFVSLALSFLGGLFVPMELLSEGMLKVARFLPTYWYADTFDKINALTSYSAQALEPVVQGLLLQLIFAVTFFCLSLLISKYKSSENGR